MAETGDRASVDRKLAGTPRITVHVPCHNYGRFLGDALDRLLRQSFSAWEAIVIDDAS